MLSDQEPLVRAAPAVTIARMLRTYVYVDGFNLYYGAVRRTEFKWLDLVKLAYQVLPPGHAVERLRYFTARVLGAGDTDAPTRQREYLKALETLPEVEIHFGTFLAKSIWRPLLNLPIADRTIDATPRVTLPEGEHPVTLPETADQVLPVGRYSKRRPRAYRGRKILGWPVKNAVIAESHTMEEKGTDVNLAVHLLNDAWMDRFDVAAVVSNDTDLVEPIRLVAEERGKEVIAVCPRPSLSAHRLKDVASRVRHIRKRMLQASQFPDCIPGTSIMRPESW